MKRLFGAVLGIAMLAGSTTDARANITYNLVGVTLQDQYGKDAGTLTGSFTTNDAITEVLSANIVAPYAKGDIYTFAGTTYTYPGATLTESLPTQFFQLDLGSGAYSLRLYFPNSPGLKTTGADLVTGGASYEHEYMAGNRIVTGGKVVAASAIPEPSSMIMIGTASAFGLGIWKRRRATA